MTTTAERLREIKSFKQLLAYLRDELDWPIDKIEIDDVDSFFDYDAEEDFGLEKKSAAKIDYIKQLRPLISNQEWGIFFIKFEPKKLPMVAMRRLLNKLVMKKRASANKSDQATWQMHDLLFISQYGEGEERKISFAQFAESNSGNLADLKVLAWGETQTDLTLDDLDQKLRTNLTWPTDPNDADAWRDHWSAAFKRRHGHVINTSKELATQLAILAKGIFTEAEKILAIENENGPLTKLYKAFQQALIHDLVEKDFADMYAQTITYGLFSTAVSGTKENNPFGRDTFVNTERMVQLVPNTNPFLREMLSTFLTAGGEKDGVNFDELGINEVVDVLNDPKTDLPAIIREFGAKKKDEDPVIHFYEEFLKAYDDELRFKRGVFYTPQPVVSFIVRSVHELLQTEFGLEDGLADTTTWGEMVERFNSRADTSYEHKRVNSKEEEGDDITSMLLTIPDGIDADDPFVQILDPATGTATFLVEVIETIERTCKTKWCSELLNKVYDHKKDRELPELLEPWNEYVPKHLLPRVYGYELMMAPYAIAHMKIGLKLTETGYRFGSEERARVFLTNALEPQTNDDQKVLGNWFPALASEARLVNEVKDKTRFTIVIGNPPYAVSSWNAGEWITNLAEDYKRSVRKQESQIQSLSNDYIKFLRLAQWQIETTGCGCVGMITGHGFLHGTQPRDLRHSLSSAFTSSRFIDLHGSIRRESTTDENDEPVFEIMTGVAITIASQHMGSADVRQTSLTGKAKHKFDVLSTQTATVMFHEVDSYIPTPPYFHFAPSAVGVDIEAEYQSYSSIPQIFGTGNQQADKEKLWATGMASQQDDLAISFDANERNLKVQALANSESFESLQESYRICTTNQWNYDQAKQFARSADWENHVGIVTYRPFDERFSVLHKHILTILRRRVMSQFDGNSATNVGLVVSRAVNDAAFAHAFVTVQPIDKIFISSKSSTNAYVFPLYTSEDGLFDNEKRINLSDAFVDGLTKRHAIDIKSDESWERAAFGYVLAILFSQSYRARFNDLLRVDFPRIPNTNVSELYFRLAEIGISLISVLLIEELDTTTVSFSGKAGDAVEKVSYSGDTVWIDKAKSKGFSPVSNESFSHPIGGYQPLEKWLKDRQAKGGKKARPGRKLTKEDIEHYQKMVVAIRETIRLMGEIDEVIDQHGGWPDAFVTEPLQESATEEDSSPPFA